MRTYATPDGPFPEAIFYEQHEIEQICSDALRKRDLLPSTPAPIRIERFIEKHFKVSPQYVELPAGVLGCTLFGPNGVEAVKVSRELDDNKHPSASRRLRSTLAHEAGHGLFHTHLFAIDSMDRGRRPSTDDNRQRLLCRNADVARTSEPAARPRNPRWWEVQANKAIGALLLPAGLMQIVLDQPAGAVTTTKVMGLEERTALVARLAETFDVNPQVADIRLGEFGIRSATTAGM